MFKPEHEAALRIQIRSLAAMCGLPADAPEVLKILGDTMADQARLLEEIRIEIHNQILASKPKIVATPVEMRSAIVRLREEDRANGILHT